MAAADLINGSFETLGGFAILLSVIKLSKDKLVRGVSWPHTAFFAAWGLWNVFYYPSLGQWFSFAGGLWLASINTVWLTQLVYYSQKEPIT